MTANENRRARYLSHDGVRVGEIIAHRAWRVVHPWWFRCGDDRLHSVLMKDYVWHPDESVSAPIGDGQTLFVLVGDVARAVAKAVSGEARTNTVYELRGPEVKALESLWNLCSLLSANCRRSCRSHSQLSGFRRARSTALRSTPRSRCNRASALRSGWSIPIRLAGR